MPEPAQPRRPAEVDVSIRPGWFYHPAQDGAVRTEENLVELYFTSVGRNAKLLLNVPPTRDGLLHDTDVTRLLGLRSRLDAMRASIPPYRTQHIESNGQSIRAGWELLPAGAFPAWEEARDESGATEGEQSVESTHGRV
jgi:alpha-L-fucosidase